MVVLPDPLGPRSPKMWPRGTCNVSWSTARILPYRLVSDRVSITRSLVVMAATLTCARELWVNCQRRLPERPGNVWLAVAPIRRPTPDPLRPLRLS